MKAHRVIVAAALSLVPLAISAVAQDKSNSIVGTWEFVSSTDKSADGTPRWPAGTKGTLMIAPNGRYAFMLSRTDIQKFAANSIEKGTPDENAMAMRGAFGHFGTYIYDPAAKTLTTVQEGSNYPNAIGARTTRKVTALTDDELRYTNPSTAVNAVAEAVFRRVK